MQRLNLLLALCTCVLAQFGLFTNGIEVTNLQYGGEDATGALTLSANGFRGVINAQ